MLKPVYTFFILFLVAQISWAQKGSTSSSSKQTPLVNIDVGGSTGTYNGNSYSELNLGVNLNFTDWLTWRNSAFKRLTSIPGQDYAGLDSTMRLVSNTPIPNGGAFRLFVGAGYRFTDHSDKNAEVGEAGLGFNAGRFGLGMSAKYLRYDKVQFDSNGVETKRDDLVYSVTLSGGAGFSF